MTAFILLLSIILAGYLVALIALYLREKAAGDPKEWPRISIWVAARNEEASILNCLGSLDQLDYPKDKLEILLGDDGSEDRTAALVQDFIANKSQFRYLFIDGKLGKADKKANVLAHLAHASTGDLYLICDADIQVKPTWAKELVKNFIGNTGVVSATTLIADTGWYARMQRIDWLYLMGLLKSAANLGIPCTAVGNNMAVSKEAYWATGGYENIDFSITEDFKLFRAIIERGYGWKHLNNAASTSISAPVPDFRTLLTQRKRWLIGGRELPVHWKLLLGLHASFDPLFVVLLFFNLPLALILFVGRIFLQAFIIYRLFNRIGENPPNPLVILEYLVFSAFLSACSLVYYLLPNGKEWKARKY
ncbi:MAG: glycosyltransferase [Bacteroidia bacterium]